MRKLFAIIGVWLSIALIAASAYAADPGVACAQTAVTKAGSRAMMMFTCTAGTDNSFAPTAISSQNMASLSGYWIDEVQITAGATAPTNGSTVAITMLPSGQDILNARGVSSGTPGVTTSLVPIKDTVSSVYGGKTITGTATLAIAGNSVASAIVYVLITAWSN